jgi:hypothetical protein
MIDTGVSVVTGSLKKMMRVTHMCRASRLWLSQDNEVRVAGQRNDASVAR